MSQSSQTPEPGFALPPYGYQGRLKWQEWGGWLSANGPGWGAHTLNNIAERRDENKANIIAIYGPPGEGKTYAGITLSEILDPTFDVRRQVLFTREQIMNVIDGTTEIDSGQCLVIDESQFSMNARTFANTDQIDLMNQLAAIRARGFIIFIIVLDTSMIDKIARGFVLTHKMFMLRRGHARVYQYKMGPLTKEPYPTTLDDDFEIPMPDSNGPGSCVKHCLKCKASGIVKGRWKNRLKWREQGYQPCQHQRAIYERLKRRFLETSAANDTAKHRKTPKIGQSDRRLFLSENIDKLSFTQKKMPAIGSISDLYETELGGKATARDTESDRRWLMEKHGDAIRRRIEEIKNE
jgi:hypothetical protein